MLATLLAATAALTVLPDDISRWVTAGCAFASAVITGITTSFNPLQLAHRALMKYVGWTRLLDEAQRFDRWLDTPEDKSFESVEHELEALQQYRDRIFEEETTGSDRDVYAIVSELGPVVNGDGAAFPRGGADDRTAGLSLR